MTARTRSNGQTGSDWSSTHEGTDFFGDSNLRSASFIFCRLTAFKKMSRNAWICGWSIASSRRSCTRLRSGLIASGLRSLQKVFWDFSHVESFPFRHWSQRTGDAAVLADTPKVDSHENHDDERQQ
jgi:hypothetical protein